MTCLLNDQGLHGADEERGTTNAKILHNMPEEEKESFPTHGGVSSLNPGGLQPLVAVQSGRTVSVHTSIVVNQK